MPSLTKLAWEGYLKVVLTQLSLFLNQEINENIDATGSARDQLTQLGLNFIILPRPTLIFLKLSLSNFLLNI